ncbi:hypothetical protein [Actinomyces gaoshouyii]|uniref:Uncharacterized protein n=1 Tax=Actinomyces gaoshouyii TaxID=1960083 RepID=A0A8H9HBN2_9ACTO|nr:hypothetical protein GCM10011612_06250 [Actinomyces gaoshouyii]
MIKILGRGERSRPERADGAESARTPGLAPRLLALAMAGACLLTGLDAALLRLSLPAPVTDAGLAPGSLASLHGPLMLVGFLGTVISLERAVAARTSWAFLAPAGLALGSLLGPAGAPQTAGRLIMLAGALALGAIYIAVHRRAPSVAGDVEALGAIALILGILLWAAGAPIEDCVPLWLLLPTLTIVGERLELARVAFLDGVVETVVAALSATALLGACLHPAGDWAAIIIGPALLGLAVTMVYHDVARRTIRSRGRAAGAVRFSAASMLAGYLWVAVAGAVWTIRDLEGNAYEIIIHCLCLGFAFSMILAHASTIIPAVVHRKLLHHPLMWLPFALLHGGLALRVGALAVGALGPWQVGGVVGIIGILAFMLIAVTRAVSSGRIGSRP